MYPDDSVQSWPTDWWVKDEKRTADRGRLVRTFVPYPEQKPHRLIPEARGTDPTDHSRALVKIEPFRLGEPAKGGGLPVPALPLHPGESYFVQRGKIRPAVILSVGGSEVPKELRRGEPAYQSARTLLVAPFYGGDKDGMRAGWNPEFVTRIRHAEYPQYVWDKLPLPGAEESILRLDHVFPVGEDPAGYELKEYRLGEDALALLDEWILWLFTGSLPEQSILADIRRGLAEP
jgi:hypothetical protein